VALLGQAGRQLATVPSAQHARVQPLVQVARLQAGRTVQACSAGSLDLGQEVSRRAEPSDNSSVTPHQRMQQHPHPC